MDINNDKKEKEKAINLAISQIEKEFGQGTIMRLSGDEIVPVEAIPTGALALDIALGVGGMPRGRVIEIFGHEGTGKTTLCLHVIAEAQKMGGTAAFIDVEHALDPVYAKKIGVDLEKLLISQPDTAEQALEIVETLVRSNAIDVIIVDSVAGLAPRAEIEGEMGDSHMGLIARLMSQALRKLSGIISKTKTCVIFTNQIRQKIGIVYGNPETTPGGLALKFHASVRLELRTSSGAAIKEGEKQIGTRIRAKVAKNKVAPPFRQAEFDIIYAEGISKEGNILDVAVGNGIVQKGGAWYSYKDKKLGQGRNNVVKFLKEDPELTKTIEDEVRSKLSVFAEEGEKTASNEE